MKNRRIARNNEWVGAWAGREMMMMSAERGIYLSLSETGGRIWELLEQPGTVESLCRQMQAEYEVPASELQEQVEGFIGQMAAQGVIHVDVDEIA